MSEILPSGGPWSRFTRDPRDPEVSGLRAGDADRAVLADVLGEAFADGRLSREEYDERSETAERLRTFGDMLPLMDDLVPATGAAAPPLRRTSPDLEREAVKAYERKRRDAWVEALTITLICTGIWLAISLAGGGFDPHFPWPIIVGVVAFADAIEKSASREKYVAKERDKIERRARKQQRKELPDS
ncbi:MULTISPECIES: DUF1707 SHOCT-like domain-containing protein [Mumia]|uniref:DUF1707 domain-containing protein n=1 Tax=Mumia xiangluensis TaxID=1678900 RepID=A0ABW1QQK0_9ACTN|nr:MULTISPECIES: DUF1707 domain-containing protein [Mumia]